MKNSMQARLFLAMGTWLVQCCLLSCAADVDSYGSCSLSCDNPRAAGSNMRLAPLFPVTELAYTCSIAPGAGKIPDDMPRVFEFKISEKLPTAGSSDTKTETGTDDGATSTAFDYGVKEVEAGNIAFTPAIMTGLLADKAELSGLKGRDEYKGVVTPPSNWCSDSCGVMKLTVWPVCIEGETNTVTVGVSVQGAQLEKPYVLKLAN